LPFEYRLRYILLKLGVRKFHYEGNISTKFQQN
jgi:hypothetical protein